MDEEDEIDPEESKRERERAKIRELKKRKITCGLTIPSRSRTVNAVFIRRDLEDESAEVDISLDDPSAPGELTVNPSPEMDIDSERVPHPSSAQTTATSLPFIRQSRIRQPSSKLRARENADLHGLAASGQKKGRRKVMHGTTAAPIPELPVLKSTTEEAPMGESRGAGKPKPETYKQAWSVSEQHLLERLLEEIPDGEKNR
jgi:hypothetical protein